MGIPANSDSSDPASDPQEIAENSQPRASPSEVPPLSDDSSPIDASILRGNGILPCFGVDVSHQEVSMVIDEIESIYAVQPGTPWLPVSTLERLLCSHSGYSDVNELEDALKSSLLEFLQKLPHVETGTRRFESGEVDYVMRVAADPPRAEWRPKRYKLKITDRSQLWTVFLKSKQASVEIPEVEFEIGAEHRRQIDTIYHHISRAVFNLESYARTLSGANENKMKILETVTTLRQLLDVEFEFHWIVTDMSGFSEFQPMDGVEVELGCGEGVDLPEITPEQALAAAAAFDAADAEEAEAAAREADSAR